MSDNSFSVNKENEVFHGFVFYATLLLVKTFLMSLVTAFFRFTTKSFGNPEDAGPISADKDEIKKMLVPNESVERVKLAYFKVVFSLNSIKWCFIVLYYILW